MNLSCRLSSTKHTTTSPLFLHQISHISKNTSSFFGTKCLHVKPITNASFTILSLRNYNKLITYPFATLSSFAEAEGEEQHKDDEIHLNGHHHHHHATITKSVSEEKNDDLPGYAKAFKICSRTASAIAICMAMATLVFPFFMTSLGQDLALKTKLLSYATLLFGFYMAWNIGANDVANAMGTSVGSGALTLRQAVLIAAVLEFSGAMLMGTRVTSTMQKGILVADVFQGNDSLLFAGLLSSLAASGTWLQVTIKF